jgi:hypothetical protein
MQQRLSRDELLNNLVTRGAISRNEADDIRDAPEWSVGIKELVSYLAALIIAVGVIRTVAVALEDASKTSIAMILYLCAAVLGAAWWRLNDRSAAMDRLSEVCELGTLLALGIASGLLLSETDLSAESFVSVMGALLLGWGLWRAPHTRFSGAIECAAGVPILSAALGILIVDANPSVVGVLLLVGGAGLLVVGWTDIGSAFIVRAAACLDIVVASLMLAEHYQGAFRLLPIVTGAIMFGVGSVQLSPEMLLAGAFVVIVGVITTVVDWVSSEIAQGLVIVATGLVVLAVLGVQMRRAVNSRSTGEPTA